MKEENNLKRVYPTQPLVGVGAILVCNGKLLLAKRKEMPGRGEWTVPGGLVELGESSEETVIREAEEEANLLAQDPRLVDVVNNIILNEAEKVKYHYVVIEYFMKVRDGKLKAADDVAKLRWVSFDEVKNYDLTKAFRKFFKRRRQNLEKLDSFKI